MWKNFEYAKCFGNWEIADSECIRCSISEGCEKKTKNKSVEIAEINELEDISECETPEKISPLEYLLQRLAGKFEKDEEEKGKAKIYKFRLSGKLKIAVIVGESGKIKVMSFQKKTEKILDGLNSVDDAEDILKEML